MELEFQYLPGILRINLKGELVQESAAGFKTGLKAHLTDCPNLILDFSQLTYLDNPGLQCLLKVAMAAMQQDIKLKIAHVNADVKILLEITSADEVLDIYPSFAQAQKACEVTV